LQTCIFMSESDLQQRKSRSLVSKKNHLSFGWGSPWWFNKVDCCGDAFSAALVLILHEKSEDFWKYCSRNANISFWLSFHFYSIEIECLSVYYIFRQWFLVALCSQEEVLFILQSGPFLFNQDPFSSSPGHLNVNGALFKEEGPFSH